MSSNKKYKLVSVAADGGKAPCAFFGTPRGCRQGDACTFSHETNVGAKSAPDRVSNEVGLVVSSESEDEKPQTPIVKSVAKSSSKPAPSVTSVDKSSSKPDEDDPFIKKKENRRGKRSEDHLPFVNPKKKAKTESTSSADASNKVILPSSASSAVTSKVAPPSKSVATPPPTKKRVPGFLSLNLPIASFSLPTTTKKVDEVAEKGEAMDEGSDKETGGGRRLENSKLPLPKSTAVGRKWLEAVQKTRSHRRYVPDYDFEKFKKADEEAGISAASGWVKAKPYGDWCADSPQSIAIDCEMCETQDPVSGKKNHKALCRISIVDGETKEVLLDTLVKPAWPVIDYRTWVNGIKQEDLEKVQFTVRHAQAYLMALCSEETIILGHAVHNDLAACQMEHHCVVDSVSLFAAADSENASVSLKDLAASVLQKEMPETHDSVNDALTALLCLEHYLEKDGDVQAVERTTSKTRPTNPDAKHWSFYASQLFVHRIPRTVDENHLSKLFLSHSDVQPSEVQPIDFAGGTSGKTHVIFQSPRHANLAFDCLEGGKAEADPSGRMQKKVFLRNKSYIRIRKMAFERDDKDTNGKEANRRKSLD
jgi:RNA exonuclease 1